MTMKTQERLGWGMLIAVLFAVLMLLLGTKAVLAARPISKGEPGAGGPRAGGGDLPPCQHRSVCAANRCVRGGDHEGCCPRRGGGCETVNVPEFSIAGVRVRGHMGVLLAQNSGELRHGDFILALDGQATDPFVPIGRLLRSSKDIAVRFLRSDCDGRWAIEAGTWKGAARQIPYGKATPLPIFFRGLWVIEADGPLVIQGAPVVPGTFLNWTRRGWEALRPGLPAELQREGRRWEGQPVETAADWCGGD